MVKAVPIKSEGNAKNANKKKKQNQIKPGAPKPGKVQASKPIKINNGVPAKNQNKAEKKKKDKQTISDEADENEEVISNDVADLLQRLKKEHGLPDNLNQLSATTNGDGKKEKTKKKNQNKPSPKKDGNQSESKANVALSKPTQNKKIVFGDNDDDDNVVAGTKLTNGTGTAPAKGKGNKNKNKAGKQVKEEPKPAKEIKKEPKPAKEIKKEPKPNNKRQLDTDIDSSVAESSPAKISKLNDAERTAKRLEKKKNKKKNKALAVEAAKQATQGTNAADSKTKGKDKTKPENASNEKKPNAKPKKEAEKKEPLINKKTNQPYKVNPIYNTEGASSIYVGNLPLNVSVVRKKIVKKFRQYGKVLSVRICNNTGGRIYFQNSYDQKKLPKNTPFLIAFVCFENKEIATASLVEDGSEIGGNIINVKLDRTNNVSSEAGETKYFPKRTVFIGNLPYSTTEVALREAFKCCGEIEYVRILQGEQGCKGTAYICFKGEESVTLALKLDKTTVLDREIHVERYHTKKLGGGTKAKGELKKKSGYDRRVQGKPTGTTKPNVKGGFGMKKHAGGADKKKKEFVGEKTDKKKKFKKQKGKSGPKLLAEKIAPKKGAAV